VGEVGEARPVAIASLWRRPAPKAPPARPPDGDVTVPLRELRWRTTAGSCSAIAASRAAVWAGDGTAGSLTGRGSEIACLTRQASISGERATVPSAVVRAASVTRIPRRERKSDDRCTPVLGNGQTRVYAPRISIKKARTYRRLDGWSESVWVRSVVEISPTIVAPCQPG
jgi:hypothetical protein